MYYRKRNLNGLVDSYMTTYSLLSRQKRTRLCHSDVDRKCERTSKRHKPAMTATKTNPPKMHREAQMNESTTENKRMNGQTSEQKEHTSSSLVHITQLNCSVYSLRKLPKINGFLFWLSSVWWVTRHLYMRK